MKLGQSDARYNPCYAELHYAPFGRTLSRLWQPWPEIYLDVPWRVTLGRPLPLLLAYADADRWPVRLLDLDLLLLSPRGEIRRQSLEVDLRLDQRIGGSVLALLELDLPGTWDIWVDARVERLPGPGGATGARLRFRNQLAPGLPEEPLRTRVDALPLPRLPGMLQGDPHTHASGTRDMIEFGPPPELLLEAARALELDWFALTDHSYDLDNAVDSWTRRDAALPTWQSQQEWIRTSRLAGGPLVIAGEECSVGGAGGGILHLLLLNPDRFWPGSADSGERLLPQRPEWRLPQLLEALRGTGCLPLSAHTGEVPGFGERLFLRRRAWRTDDMRLLGAHQILSGGRGPAFVNGRRNWIELMSLGQFSSLVAGNDSHGHFSLGRSVLVPSFTLHWGRGQLFGRYRSAICLPTDLAESFALPAVNATTDERDTAVIAELAAGRVLATDGPLLWLEDDQGTRSLGGPVPRSRCMHLCVVLPEACGELRWLRLLSGTATGEDCLAEWTELGKEASLPLDPAWLARPWLRAELRQTDGFAMSNAWRPED